MRAAGIAALGLLAVACGRGVPKHRSATLYAESVPSPASPVATARATLVFDGMLCEGCAVAAQQALAKVPGVRAAHVDFQRRTATVEFEPRRTSGDALASALEHVDRSPAPPFHVTRRDVEP